jgi:hypothetical protein
MKRIVFLRIAVSLVLVGFACLDFARAVAAPERDSSGTESLMAVGNPGPKAIDLTIRTDKPEGYRFKPGDTLALHVRADRKAYLTAVYLSSRGDAVILFPNRKTQDNLILSHKDYSLFGESDPVKLRVSDTMKEGRIVFFVSSSPFSLDPLKMTADQPCVQIPASAHEQLDILKRKIEDMAKDEGFNRVLLSVKAGGSVGISLNLMGLPTAIKSEKPETVTGVQGVQSEPIEEQKDTSR